MSSKKCLVTGGTGFIGYNLCRKLIRENWQVFALVRATSDTKDLQTLGVELVNASVTDPASMRKEIPDNLDAVFHLAGVTSQFYKDYQRQTEVNLQGTKNLLDVAAEKNLGRFIHVSSIMAFGLHKEVIDENTASNADQLGNNYSWTKWKSENLALHAAQSGMDVLVVNPSHIIGPYDQHTFIQMFEAIYKNQLPGVPPGGGMFCHVEDICESLVQAYEKGVAGEKYLVGGAHYSFLEVATEIKLQLNKKGRIGVIPKWVFKMLLPFYTMQGWITGKEPLLTKWKIEISAADIHCDDSKARSLFGLKYRSLKEMVKDTLDWYTAQLATKE